MKLNMDKTNAVVISVNTMDGDLLNDVFRILNILRLLYLV